MTMKLILKDLACRTKPTLKIAEQSSVDNLVSYKLQTVGLFVQSKNRDRALPGQTTHGDCH